MHHIEWVKGLISQFFEWIVRPRSLGIALLSRSSTLLVFLASGFSIKARGFAGILDVFEFSSGDGIPGHLITLLVYMACMTWLIGLGMVVFTQIREWKEGEKRRILVVEMRGLVDTSDKPLIKFIPSTYIGRRINCLVDVRKYLAGPNPNVNEAINDLNGLPRLLRQHRGDTDRGDVQVVAGGVMQVPLLFFAGVLLDDEGHVELFDWERSKGEWKQLNELDDANRFEITGLEHLDGCNEAVLVVSASYLADFADIAKTFPNLPIVRMARPNPQVNSIWSEESQAELTQQFLQTLGALANHGVKLVHLILVAPSTLAIRFGKAYDHRNMPMLRCYQREQEQTPPYPWSIQMPSSAQKALVVKTPLTSPAQ